MAQKKVKAEAELIKTDTEFSDYSVKNGMNKAFFEYSDNTVVLLKPNMMPLKGIEALKDFHANINDSEITLSWVPSYARASKSGDLGYTYGTWKLEAKDGEFSGTYVSIWQKGKDGKWKLVLDTGNTGLGN